ncbi:TPA: glycerophosphodiester phosphodiesterase, partial [Legionella pneumophila subsp. pneumophila]|nr:glycerophosphodiester phosphodiesterase [Legionella pneumophila subsp. pneumophila]
QHFGVGFVDSKNSLYRELNRGVKWLFTNEAININQYLNDLKNRM